MSHVTTHVLDTSTGRPASDIDVALEDSTGQRLASGSTDADGRISSLGPERLEAGDYLLRFATGPYLLRSTLNSTPSAQPFYPEVTITFTIGTADEHYHVPLLLSPFGYSTYRGS